MSGNADLPAPAAAQSGPPVGHLTRPKAKKSMSEEMRQAVFLKLILTSIDDKLKIGAISEVAAVFATRLRSSVDCGIEVRHHAQTVCQMRTCLQRWVVGLDERKWITICSGFEILQSDRTNIRALAS